MEKQTLIKNLQKMAQEHKKPSELLRYMVLDLDQQQQLELMIAFTEAFDCTLGEVTAIGGWWHDDSAELNDNDIDAYITPLLTEWLANQA